MAILTGDYIETHGDLTIYSRWDHWAETFDVVRDGVCIAMRAGLEGARHFREGEKEMKASWIVLTKDGLNKVEYSFTYNGIIESRWIDVDLFAGVVASLDRLVSGYDDNHVLVFVDERGAILGCAGKRIDVITWRLE